MNKSNRIEDNVQKILQKQKIIDDQKIDQVKKKLLQSEAGKINLSTVSTKGLNFTTSKNIHNNSKNQEERRRSRCTEVTLSKISKEETDEIK